MTNSLIPIAIASNKDGHACREFFYDKSFTFIYCFKTIDTDGTPPSLSVYLTGRIDDPLQYLKKRWEGTDDIVDVTISTKKFALSPRRRSILNAIETALVAYSDDPTAPFLYTGDDAARVCWQPPGFLARTRILFPLTGTPRFALGHATLTISPVASPSDVTSIASHWKSTPNRSPKPAVMEGEVQEWNNELLRAVRIIQKASNES